MADGMLQPFSSVSPDLDYTIYEQARATFSVVSISSTVTASDLPGAGRTLGNLYSYLGKRLENLLNRLMERHGYGPRAIEQRILCNLPHFGYDIPEPGPKRERQIRKELKCLLRYTHRKWIRTENWLAKSSRPSLSHTHTFVMCYVRLAQTKTLAFVCARVERDIAYEGLLSPSRKALICLMESEMNTVGKRWILLHQEFYKYGLDTDFANSLYLKQHEDAYVEAHGIILKHMSSRSPEQAFLAMSYYACYKSNPHRFKWRLGVYKRHYVNEDADDRALKLLEKPVRTIYFKVSQSPHNVEWTAVTNILTQLVWYSFQITDLRSQVVHQYLIMTIELVDDLSAKFATKFTSEDCRQLEALGGLMQLAQEEANN